MTDSTNLTVRLDVGLKRDFKMACEYLGFDASDVVRRAIRQTINDYRILHKSDREYATNFVEENENLEIVETIKSYIQQKNNNLRKKITNID